MEELLVKVLLVIERNMDKKLRKLEALVRKNREDFRSVLSQKDALQGRIMKLYCLEDSEASLAKQISFMFKMVGQDLGDAAPFHFDVSREDSRTVLRQSVDICPRSGKNLFFFSVPPEFLFAVAEDEKKNILWPSFCKFRIAFSRKTRKKFRISLILGAKPKETKAREVLFVGSRPPNALFEERSGRWVFGPHRSGSPEAHCAPKALLRVTRVASGKQSFAAPTEGETAHAQEPQKLRRAAETLGFAF